MKNGYIQTKMSELNEQLRQIKNEGTTLRLQLQSIEKRIGEYDALLEKLEDLKQFRKDFSNSLIKDNEQLINTHNDSIIKELVGNVNYALDIRLENINNFLNEIRKETNEINKYKQGLAKLSMIVDRNGLILFILMEQMAKRNIFTDEELRAINSHANRKCMKNLREHTKDKKHSRR